MFGADFPLAKAFKELCNALGTEKRLKKGRKTKKTQASHPLVVLAFDEVYTLAKPEGNRSWSRFGEIRRALRGLIASPLFTIFLSTSGTLFGISPPRERDVSARMFLKGEVMSPLCELGFDIFAKYLNFEETVKLYGRPLCVLNPHSVRHQLTLP